MTGGKSIPLIREAIETGRLNENLRKNLYSHLESISRTRKDKNDAEKITAFLKEIKPKE
jgi:hypothetical protein